MHTLTHQLRRLAFLFLMLPVPVFAQQPAQQQAAQQPAQQFTQPLLVITGNQPASIAATSFSADGAPALCYVDALPRGAMYTHLHCRPIQAGILTPSAIVYPLLTAAPVFSFVAVDGDARPQMVFFANAELAENPPGEIAGDGRGGTMGNVPVGLLSFNSANARWSILGVARFTSTNHIDVYAVDSANQKLVIALGDGVNSFSQHAILSLPDGNASTVLTADIDSDGNTDILTLGSIQHIVSTFTGKGDGTFTAGASYTLPGGIFSMLLTDLDGDSRPDLVVEGANGALSYFPALAAGGFSPVSVPIAGAQDASTGRGGHLMGIADRDADGLPDIVTSNPLGISVLLGQAISSAVPRVPAVQLLGIYDPGQGDPAAGRTTFDFADFNADGSTDLAVDNPHGILVLFGKPDGSFAAPRATAGTLTAAPEPSPYGVDFTLTASLLTQGSTTTPTGTVTFAVDGVIAGVPVAVSSNAAIDTVTAPTYLRGSHAIAATYSGDANYSAQIFTSTHTISGLRSQTTYFNRTPTIFFGQVADGVGSVAAVDASATATVNGGTITFYQDGSAICTLPINGTANSCPGNAGAGLSVGTHTITAAYSGNDFYDPSASDSAAGIVQVLPDITTAAVISSANPAALGQPVTLTATIAAPFATPAGAVTFFDGTAPLATVTLDASGTATFTSSALTVGTHNISVTFAATSNFNGSVSAVLVLVITPPLLPATFTAVTSSVNPSYVGQPVTFTALVTTGATVASPVAVGTVVFMVDGLLLNPINLNASGTASITATTLTQGSHTVTASFAATSMLAASASAPLTQQVNAQGAGGFTLTVSPSTLSVPIGSSVSVLITVAPLNGFAQAVNLNCTGMPDESACTFANATIPAGGGSTRLTVYAAAPHNCGASTPYFVSSGPTTILGALATAMLMGLLRRRRSLLKGFAVAVVFVLLPALPGCAGNCTDLGVRPGTYSFAVTATSTGSPIVSMSQAAQFTARL